MGYHFAHYNVLFRSNGVYPSVGAKSEQKHHYIIYSYETNELYRYTRNIFLGFLIFAICYDLASAECKDNYLTLWKESFISL